MKSSNHETYYLIQKNIPKCAYPKIKLHEHIPIRIKKPEIMVEKKYQLEVSNLHLVIEIQNIF
jgi:hypothetical protein